MSDRLTSDPIRHLEHLDACPPALAWCREQPAGLSAYALYRRCPRGDWLLWLAATLDLDRRLIVLGACDCAETALVYLPADEPRPRLAIETARAWVAGGATLADVREAARAARDCAFSASAAANTDASHAANANAAFVCAAYAARAASHAANANAAYAASHAAYAAYTCAYADEACVHAAAAHTAAHTAAAHTAVRAAACSVRAAAQRQNACLVRRRIPWRMYRDAIDISPADLDGFGRESTDD